MAVIDAVAVAMAITMAMTMTMTMTMSYWLGLSGLLGLAPAFWAY